MSLKSFNRYRFKRFFAPTAGLRHSIFLLLTGLLLFLGGVFLSFRILLRPLAESLSYFWDNLILSIVPLDGLDRTNHSIGGIFLLGGFYYIFLGTRATFRQFFETLSPGIKSSVVNTYVRRQQLAHGPRVVAIGGGTGLSTLLRGLKQHTSNITAIVTVTDDGGSSGRLVQEMGIIPPGDIRNCLVALADAEKVMTDLFQHRFKNISGSLSGHSIGNLLIAALVEQSGGDFQHALNVASEVLAIRGRVLPSTLAQARLRALMENGHEVVGETKIVESNYKIRRVFLDAENSLAHPEALEAIQEADLICIGPGSIYTSVIPNFLVPGIAEAVQDSNTMKVYICNVMTQHGETDAFTAAEHLLAIQANIEYRVFDYVLVNTGIPSVGALEKYRDSEQFLVEADIDRIRALGFRVITGNFMSETDYIWHDPLRVASRLMDLVHKGV